jgi:serine/threonine protein kinase
VHGDVKPSNIMLERTSNAKLIDIGAAFIRDDAPLHADLRRAQRSERVGGLGTIEGTVGRRPSMYRVRRLAPDLDASKLFAASAAVGAITWWLSHHPSQRQRVVDGIFKASEPSAPRALMAPVVVSW